MQTNSDPQTTPASVPQNNTLRSQTAAVNALMLTGRKSGSGSFRKAAFIRPGTRAAKDRVRSSWQLVLQFFRWPGRSADKWVLAATVTVSAVLGLLPPAGTVSFVIDLLDGKPLPEPSTTASVSDDTKANSGGHRAGGCAGVTAQNSGQYMWLLVCNENFKADPAFCCLSRL